MACELLVHRNKNNYFHTDPEKDRSSVYKKGYIVTGKTLPHNGWGNKEQFSAGNFVTLRITDATWEEILDYAEHWRQFIDYNKIGENLSIDGHRYRVYATNSGVSGRGNLTLQKIKKYLDGWNVTIFSNTTNEVVIDCIINNMLRSKSYWDYIPGDGLTDIQYSQVSYNQSTGEHIYDLDYSNVRTEIQNRSKVAERLWFKLSKRGATLLSHNETNQTARVSIFRNDVLLYFKNEVYSDTANKSPVYKRQYYIEETDVDSLVNYSTNHGGNPYELTKSSFLTYIKSMLDKGDA